MKKITLISLLLIIISVTISSLVLSDDLAIGDSFTKTNFSNKTVPQKTNLTIAQQSFPNASYSHSALNYKGDTLDYYKDSQNNTYILNDDGKVISGFMSKAQTTNQSIKTAKELTVLADDFVNKHADFPEKFELIQIYDSGSDKGGLSFYYGEKICGFKTENSFSLNYDQYGNITSFVCNENIDYSSLDTTILSRISDEIINEYINMQMNILFPNGYADPSIDDIFLVKNGNSFSLNISVIYKNSSGFSYLQELSYALS